MNETYTVLHSIPGRIRLQLNNADVQPTILEAKIRTLPGVVSASYSSIINTVVIHHKYKQFPKYHLSALLSFVKARAPKAPVKPRSDINQAFRDQAKEFSLVVGTFAIEKFFFASTTFSLITPTSAAVLFASRHIIKNGISTLLKPAPDTLTTASLLALIAQGKPTSAFIIYAMSTVSETLSEYTMHRTRGFVKDMMEMDTQDAWLVTEDGRQVKVGVEQINKGDKVIVFHGEKIPFDGVVQDYNGEVDQSSITGEYMPKHVTKGSYVYAGSIVTDGKVLLAVDKVGEDLTVNRMVKLIEDAQDKQASVQMMTENFTEKMVPISFGLAALTYLVTRDFNRVLNLLVIDYVCGVKLATATAISASIGKAARKGILLKGGQTLETMSKVNTVVFDKTGTITEGKAVVKEVLTYNGYSEDEVLTYAATAEQHSSHPIAEAICNEARRRELELLPSDVDTTENIVGRGLSVTVNGEQILVGSRKLMEDHDIHLNLDYKAGVFVAKGSEFIGFVEIEDQIRAEMNRCINQMRRSGVDEVVMLTGDQKRTAKKVAKQLSVDKFIADAMPQEKAEYVKSLRKEEARITMMVGDGINDAPALAYADIGVSLGGKKTDIAMETSDVVINSENPILLSEAVDISQRAMKTIKQNLIATFTINTAAIALGTFGIISPMIGAAIHNASTIGVVLNSARLLLPEGARLNVF